MQFSSAKAGTIVRSAVNKKDSPVIPVAALGQFGRLALEEFVPIGDRANSPESRKVLAIMRISADMAVSSVSPGVRMKQVVEPLARIAGNSCRAKQFYFEPPCVILPAPAPKFLRHSSIFFQKRVSYQPSRSAIFAKDVGWLAFVGTLESSLNLPAIGCGK